MAEMAQKFTIVYHQECNEPNLAVVIQVVVT